MIDRVRSLMSRFWDAVSSAWGSLQPQRWVSIAFVGLLLLTTSVDSADLNQSTKDALNNLIAKGENGRPVDDPVSGTLKMKNCRDSLESR